MKIIITGAAGFIGSQVAEALRKQMVGEFDRGVACAGWWNFGGRVCSAPEAVVGLAPQTHRGHSMREIHEPNSAVCLDDSRWYV